jgi:hypothetical protein
MIKFLTLAVFSTTIWAQEVGHIQELYFKNQSGGIVVLTVEPCNITKAVSLGFDFRSYATEGDGTLHEGCWMAPDVSKATQREGMNVFAIVNLYYDGIITPFKQDVFVPFSHLGDTI